MIWQDIISISCRAPTDTWFDYIWWMDRFPGVVEVPEIFGAYGAVILQIARGWEFKTPVDSRIGECNVFLW